MSGADTHCRSHIENTPRGFTLVELMIAMTIGLFLVGGALAVYLQSRQAFRTADRIARVQELARYAMDIIEPDVRMAGLWGNALSAAGGANIANAVADSVISPNCGANWIGDAAHPIDGRDNGARLSAGCSASNVGSDALIVRRTAVADSALDADKIQVRSTRLAALIVNGDTTPSAFDTGKTATHDLIVRAYYVTQSSGVFALKRRTLAGSTGAFTFFEEDIAPGIQDLQVQFGVDSDNDGQPDQYVDPDAIANRRIVSARIWLLATADEPEADFQDDAIYAYANRRFKNAFSDRRRRALLVKTIRLRNAGAL